MKTLLNFSGMGFEVGQTKSGLSHSPDCARKYFSYLRDAGVEFIDQGDCHIPNLSEKVKIHNGQDLVKIQWQKYVDVYHKTQELLDKDYPLVNWGGDHSVALSTAGAFLSKYSDGYVIWIDAHADLNLPEFSESGNFHGMPLAVLLNLKGVATEHFSWLSHTLDPKKLIYVGLRDVDPFEKEMIQSLGIKSYDFEVIKLQGIQSVAKEILEITKDSSVHVSFDIDSVDPRFAPSTGVPVKGGLTPHDVDVLCTDLLQKSKVRSIDIVEINPELGTSKQVDRTFLMALNFLSSVFNSNYLGDYYDCKGPGSDSEQFTQKSWDF